MIPSIEYSERRGFSTDNAFFWVLGRNADVLLEYQYFSRIGSTAGIELNYIPSKDGKGSLNGFFSREKIIDSLTNEPSGKEVEVWRVNYDHEQNFENGFRWVVDVGLSSSLDFNREYADDPLVRTTRDISSKSYLTKNYKTFTLTLRGEDIKRFNENSVGSNLNETTSDRQFLPALEFDGRSRQIKSLPIFFELDGSLANLGTKDKTRSWDINGNLTETVRIDSMYQRLDVHPVLRFPLSPTPWLDVVPKLDLRETIYTKKIDSVEPTGVKNIGSDLLNRNLYLFELSLTGPKMEKVYGGGRSQGKAKYKQIIEPRINFVYQPKVSRRDEIIQFEGSIDSIAGDRRDISYSFTTRFHKKMIVAEGEQELPATEVFSWALSGNYSLKSDLTFRTYHGERQGSRFSDVTSTATWRPRDYLSFRFTNRVDVQYFDLKSTSINADFRNERWGDVSFRFNQSRSLDTGSFGSTYSITSDLYLGRRRFQLENDLTFELKKEKFTLGNGPVTDYRHRFQNRRHAFTFRSQCCAITLEYLRKSITWIRGQPELAENQYRVNFSLKNAGTFINFRRRKL